MLALPSSLIRNSRSRRFYACCLSLCFASLSLAALGQSQPLNQNPNTNAPVVIPRDTQLQLQPSVQPQPSRDLWDRWGIEKVSKDDDWTRHFRIGAMVGLNISANFNTKSSWSISGNNAAKGNYDDGYVHPSSDGPNTSEWSYNDSSQYDAAHSQLLMHQATSFSPTSGTSKEENNGAFPGFETAYGGNLWNWRKTRIGWEFGFGLLPISMADKISADGNVNRNVVAFDTTDINNAYPGFFPPPNNTTTVYLPWNPLTTPRVVPATDQVSASITGSHTLDVMLYTFRLGPTLYWDLNEDLGLTVGAGPALGLMSGSLNYNETITEHLTSGDITIHNKGRVDGTDVVYGGYVNAMLTYHVEENGDLYLGVQYMSLGNANISGGGREGRLNLGGQVYITAGINWPF
jgi:hypothetical protein